MSRAWMPPMKATSPFPWESFVSHVCTQQRKENGHLRFQKSPVSLSLLSSSKPTVLLHQWSLEVNPLAPGTGSTNLALCCNSEVLLLVPGHQQTPNTPLHTPSPTVHPHTAQAVGQPLPPWRAAQSTIAPQPKSSTLDTTQAWEPLDEFSSMWKSFPFGLFHPPTGIRILQYSPVPRAGIGIREELSIHL